MPVVRKIERLPPDIRKWLEDELRSRGFGDYVAVTDELNRRLEETGSAETFHHATVHRFGVEYAEFVKVQKAADAWAKEWMTEQGIGDEAKRHNVLFQMITALAFKVMQHQMTKDGDEIDPKELHFLGRMMKDIMQSAGIREQLMAAERKQMAEKLDKAVQDGEVTEDFRVAARRIMGFA